MVVESQNGILNFSKIKTSIPIPNLIEVQIKSFMNFLQMDKIGEERDEDSLKGIFGNLCPVGNAKETCFRECLEYSVGDWKCECGKVIGLENVGGACSS